MWEREQGIGHECPAQGMWLGLEDLTRGHSCDYIALEMESWRSQSRGHRQHREGSGA